MSRRSSYFSRGGGCAKTTVSPWAQEDARIEGLQKKQAERNLKVSHAFAVYVSDKAPRLEYRNHPGGLVLSVVEGHLEARGALGDGPFVWTSPSSYGKWKAYYKLCDATPQIRFLVVTALWAQYSKKAMRLRQEVEMAEFKAKIQADRDRFRSQD